MRVQASAELTKNADAVIPYWDFQYWQSNGPSYRNTVIGTLAVDGWAVMLVQRGATSVGSQPVQAPPRCTKCNSPPINGQCTNFVLFDVSL